MVGESARLYRRGMYKILNTKLYSKMYRLLYRKLYSKVYSKLYSKLYSKVYTKMYTFLNNVTGIYHNAKTLQRIYITFRREKWSLGYRVLAVTLNPCI